MTQLTQVEKEALEKFKVRIKDLLPEIEEFQQRDVHLLRWLRARSLNLDKTEEMIRKSMAWRRDYKVDQLMTFKFPDIFVEELPWKCCGYDRDGSPVVIIPFGKWNMRKIVELGFKDDFLRGGYFCNEFEIELMKLQSNKDRTIHQAVQIIDLEGYSFTQFMSKQTIDTFSEQVKGMEDNYPEILKVIYIINAPKVFTFLFALLKPLLTPETLSKVNIFDSNPANWKPALLKNIDPDHLPSEYGGANTNCENFDDMMKTKLDAQLIQPNFTNFEDADYINVVVNGGEQINVDVSVPEIGSIMSWAFKTEEDGIGFSITNEQNETLVSCGLVDSHIHTQKGKLTCKTVGKFTFCFDNTLDRRRSKPLSYAVQIKSPIPSEEDLK